MQKYRSLYQAFQTYKQSVSEDILHQELLRSLREDNQPEERCLEQCSTLKWDPEWIEAFEAALPFVEKAIDEQRRFIESYEEIRRVDQARKTTVDSVRHLAEHSNLITRVQGDDIIPDKILIVQREDNYAIYENRFLYTLVKQMQDFLHRRYEKAKEINGLRQLQLQTSRNAKSGNLRFRSQITLDLEKLLDAPARGEGALEELSDAERVERLTYRTWQLSSMPLLRQLKGCTLVTSPIVRTNVFKKNENFKQALNLYEFLERYQKPGYEIISQDDTLPTLPDSLREDLYELQLLEALLGQLALDPDLAEGLKEDMEFTAQRRALELRQLDHAAERESRSLVSQARREETALRQHEIALREEIISQRDQEIARQRGEIADRDIRLNQAAEEIQGLQDTIEEDQRVLAQTKEEARQKLESTIAEDQRVLNRTKEEAARKLEETIAEDQRILNQAKEEAQHRLEATVAEDQRILAQTKEEARQKIEQVSAAAEKAQAAAQEEKSRLEKALHDTQAEVLQAKSDIEAERLLRRQDLDKAKQEVLDARHQASEELSRVKKESEDALRKEHQRAEEALSRIRAAEKAASAAEQKALAAERKMREQKEKIASLQKQLIQARQSAKKNENKQSLNLRDVARKVWEGKPEK